MDTTLRHSRARLALALAALLAVLAAGASSGQLPPEAVDLAKVKISEQLKSVDLDPITHEPSRADGETWTHGGVEYRAGDSASKATFLADPAKHAADAARERWIKNFMLSMSSIWCPITDEVTPGGRKQVEGLGYTWESCCSFCDDEMRPENFEEAVVRLRDRAEESYELTEGVYVEGASSPVEGAIREDF